MNKQQHFNKLLQNEKFTALAIDQGTSLKEIIKEKKRKTFTPSDYYFFNVYDFVSINKNKYCWNYT